MLTDDQIKAAIAKTEAELGRNPDAARRKTLSARLRFLRYAELVNALANVQDHS